MADPRIDPEDLAAIRREFSNPRIFQSTNPDSEFGYFYGPIPNRNHGWVPPSHVAALAEGKKKNNLPSIKIEENAEAPNLGLVLSRVNTMVCDVDVMGDEGYMEACGIVCGDQPSLRRHIRTAHPGAIINPTRDNTTTEERIAGYLALRRYVLSGGWRRAQYVNEPTDLPKDSLIKQYADRLELLARHDSEFAEQYGTKFHRVQEATTINGYSRAFDKSLLRDGTTTNSYLSRTSHSLRCRPYSLHLEELLSFAEVPDFTSPSSFSPIFSGIIGNAPTTPSKRIREDGAEEEDTSSANKRPRSGARTNPKTPSKSAQTQQSGSHNAEEPTLTPAQKASITRRRNREEAQRAVERGEEVRRSARKRNSRNTTAVGNDDEEDDANSA